jgi:hypothetical protein
MHTWSITETYLARKSFILTATDDDDLIAQVQKFADDANRDIGKLQVENFTDEMHFYFTRRNRTRIFMRVQYEGRE